MRIWGISIICSAMLSCSSVDVEVHCHLLRRLTCQLFTWRASVLKQRLSLVRNGNGKWSSNVTCHALFYRTGQTVPARVSGHQQFSHFSWTEALHWQTTRPVRSQFWELKAPQVFTSDARETNLRKLSNDLIISKELNHRPQLYQRRKTMIVLPNGLRMKKKGIISLSYCAKKVKFSNLWLTWHCELSSVSQ